MEDKYIQRTFTYNGRRYKVRGKTEREALMKLADLKRKLETDDVINPSRRTVRSWAEQAIETYKIKQNDITRQKYEEKINIYILNKIGDRPIKDILPIDCQSILNDYKHCSKSTIKEVYQMLRFIFGKAVQNRLIASDPTEGLIKPEGTSSRRRSLTPYEQRVFLHVINSHYAGLFYALMYYCGCRPSEAAAVQGRDVQMIDNQLYLHIRGTKTKNADRYVPIVPALEAMLPKHMQPYKLLCTNQNGNPINKENKRRAWKYLERLMNIEMGCKVYRNQLLPPFPLAIDLSAYSLRHTFCTNLQKQGVDIRTAQYMMGHSDITLTANIYSHAEEDFEIVQNAARQMVNDKRTIECTTTEANA